MTKTPAISPELHREPALAGWARLQLGVAIPIAAPLAYPRARVKGVCLLSTPPPNSKGPGWWSEANLITRAGRMGPTPPPFVAATFAAQSDGALVKLPRGGKWRGSNPHLRLPDAAALSYIPKLERPRFAAFPKHNLA